MKSPIPLSLSVQYADLRAKDIASRQQIRRWVKAAIRQPAMLTIRFVDEAEGQAINRDFRHKDYATNVLTFTYDAPPYGEDESAAAEADIILCTDVILKEAKEQKKTPAAHLAHLIIHGVLHAQGHDHETDADAEKMEVLETAILSRFSIADPYA
ncbi:rRNA maturation RNase YbeY [Oxalobacter vibrioformis]|uniref:Endoribonuclease YbeY n=1 Tax=Oxalobacter vibrioformis TaxID=933080 RepID=A0A9E9LVE9_9BURK|nr:rRNA maturation RNase YbeY [Oxalobacter vibrioformis]WAW09574.1 rRNA maturation RNase YbeY [Oxalobacter vibrioformis]